MGPLKIRKVGNSMGLTLPKEALSHMKVDEGDLVYLIETSDGFRITPYDPEFADQMNAARGVMKRRRRALRELAK